MAREQRKKLSGLRLGFFLILAILAIAIILVVKNIISLNIEQSDLKDQESALQEKKDELTEELKNVDDLEYIEEQARKLLRMIKPGEVLYIIDGAGEDGSARGTEDGDTDDPAEATDEDSDEKN